MYKILSTDGTQIAVTEEIRYIRKHSNGAYVQTDADTAEGVAVNGTAYSIIGQEPLDGAEETVIIREFDGASALIEAEAKLAYLAMMAGIDFDLEDTTEEVKEDE